MSEGYREETQSEVDMTEPHGVLQNTAPGDFGDYPADHNAELDMDNFIWEDVLEEIGRFENFDVDMTFSLSEWSSYTRTRPHITSGVCGTKGRAPPRGILVY